MTFKSITLGVYNTELIRTQHQKYLKFRLKSTNLISEKNVSAFEMLTLQKTAFGNYTSDNFKYVCIYTHSHAPMYRRHVPL